MADANMVFIEKYLDVAGEKNCKLIEEKMTMWVDSCNVMNEAARNFASVYLCDYPENVIAGREKNFTGGKPDVRKKRREGNQMEEKRGGERVGRKNEGKESN